MCHLHSSVAEGTNFFSALFLFRIKGGEICISSEGGGPSFLLSSLPPSLPYGHVVHLFSASDTAPENPLCHRRRRFFLGGARLKVSNLLDLSQMF